MYTLAELVNERRKILEAALNRKRRVYDANKDAWLEFPCSKEESIEIALEAYDEIAYQTKEMLYASRALETLMNNHGLVLGKDFSLQEYVATRMAIEEEENTPIRVVKG